MNLHFQIQERQTALSYALLDLNQILEHLRHLHYINRVNALGLELPNEKPFNELIVNVVQTYRQTTGLTDER